METCESCIRSSWQDSPPGRYWCMVVQRQLPDTNALNLADICKHYNAKPSPPSSPLERAWGDYIDSKDLFCMEKVKRYKDFLAGWAACRAATTEILESTGSCTDDYWVTLGFLKDALVKLDKEGGEQ